MLPITWLICSSFFSSSTIVSPGYFLSPFSFLTVSSLLIYSCIKMMLLALRPTMSKNLKRFWLVISSLARYLFYSLLQPNFSNRSFNPCLISFIFTWLWVMVLLIFIFSERFFARSSCSKMYSSFCWSYFIRSSFCMFFTV